MKCDNNTGTLIYQDEDPYQSTRIGSLEFFMILNSFNKCIQYVRQKFVAVFTQGEFAFE